MPQNQAHLPARPPAASGAGNARQGAARSGAGPRRRARRGSAPGSGRRPAGSTRGAGGPGNPRSAIDLALEAALATPAPAATSFRELGLPAPLAEALRPLRAHGVAVISDPYEGPRGEAAWQPSPDRLKLLWFGHPSNLNTLQGLLAELVEIGRKWPVQLTLPCGSLGI